MLRVHVTVCWKTKGNVHNDINSFYRKRLFDNCQLTKISRKSKFVTTRTRVYCTIPKPVHRYLISFIKVNTSAPCSKNVNFIIPENMQCYE